MKKILFFLLFPSIVFAEECNQQHQTYFKNEGEAQMIEGSFTFGFNGILNKKLHFTRFCLTTTEENVNYEFVADGETVWNCNSSDCCKDHTLELLPSQNINIKADKETSMQWSIEACYFD